MKEAFLSYSASYRLPSMILGGTSCSSPKLITKQQKTQLVFN